MIKKSKLVYGVGINDAGYPVTIYASVNGRRKQLWLCPFYRAWAGMMRRCYSAKCRAAFPTYKGCTVALEWRYFSAFRDWMTTQDWEGNQLDKDILRPGNKVYSPGTCVFVSCQLNSFLLDSAAARGSWPIGVDWFDRYGKFRARCRNPFTKKLESLGYFTEPSAAHESWRARKHELACQYADQQTDQRIAEALRARHAIKS